MNNLSEMLRAHAIKVTPQRLAVLSSLTNCACHRSVDDVYQKVKETVPAISLATVYAILQNFSDKGLVAEIRIDDERSLYEAHKEPHHHFLCRRCRKIFDVTIDHPCPALKAKSIEGHDIESFQGYFFGVCKSCRKRQKSSSFKKSR